MSARTLEKFWSKPCVFTIYKHRGISDVDAAAFVKLQVQDDLQCDLRKIGINISFLGILGVESHGIMCCCSRKKIPKKFEAFTKLPARYLVSTRLGSKTDNGYDNGNVVLEKAYDHITKDNFKSALLKFKGQMEQIHTYKIQTNAEHSHIFGASAAEMKVPTKRILSCDEIFCTAFCPPHVSFEISCNPFTNISLLVEDLGKELNTCIHIKDSQRIAHGPFTLKDALPKYCWTWKYVQEAMLASAEKVDMLCKLSSR